MANPDLSDIENAVMDHLWRESYHTTVFKGRERLLEDLDKIAEARAWADKLTAAEGRKYYLKWLDYFAGCHHNELKTMDAEDRKKAILPSVPAPPRI